MGELTNVPTRRDCEVVQGGQRLWSHHAGRPGWQPCFVHFSAIRSDPVRFPTGYRFLKEGQTVAFDLLELPFRTLEPSDVSNIFLPRWKPSQGVNFHFQE